MRHTESGLCVQPKSGSNSFYNNEPLVLNDCQSSAGIFKYTSGKIFHSHILLVLQFPCLELPYDISSTTTFSWKPPTYREWVLLAPTQRFIPSLSEYQIGSAPKMQWKQTEVHDNSERWDITSQSSISLMFLWVSAQVRSFWLSAFSLKDFNTETSQKPDSFDRSLQRI